MLGALMRSAMTRPDCELSGLDDTEEDFASATLESRLVDEARRGSQSAFGELVSRYERRLIRVILQFVKNQELAEDLAQEAFLKAYQRLSQFDPSRISCDKESDVDGGCCFQNEGPSGILIRGLQIPGSNGIWSKKLQR